ncbi:MAG: septal ring lytic transglycosylase RlpA family protein, partial [Cyanobacteria bacterium J06576_12]
MNVFQDLPKLLWSMGGIGVGIALPMAMPLAPPVKAESMPIRVSWYGPGFDGGYTASGEIFDRYDYTAAHPTWPFGTILQLTHPDTGSRVLVRVNDRSGGALD